MQGKLSNERFVSNAPDEVVEAERAKEKDYLEKQEAVKERIAQYVQSKKKKTTKPTLVLLSFCYNLPNN